MELTAKNNNPNPLSQMFLEQLIKILPVVKPYAYFENVKAVFENFSEIVKNSPAPVNPSDYFDSPTNYGLHKVVYKVGEIVLKFTNFSDIVEQEIKTYSRSQSYIPGLLCPTAFVLIPKTINIYLDELNPRATYLIIQPNCFVEKSRPREEYLYEEPLNDNVNFFAPYRWRQDVSYFFNDKNIADYLNFLNIEDLYSGNVGWLDGKPVIIDWF